MSSEDKPGPRPLGSSGMLAASQVGAAGVAFLTSLFVGRMLGPADFGLAGLVVAFPMLLFSILSLKPLYVLARYMTVFRAEGRRRELAGICKLGYGIDLATSLAVLAVVAAAGPWVARHLMQVPSLGGLMILFAASLPAYTLLGTSQSVFNALEKFGWVTLFTALEKAMTAALVVALVLAGRGVPGVIVGTVASYVVTGLSATLIAAILLRREGIPAWWTVPLRTIADLRKELRSVFGWNFLVVTFTGLLANLPLILMGRLRGPEEAGHFRMATALANFGGYVELSLGQVVFPEIARRWSAGEREELRGLFWKWTRERGLAGAAVVLVAVALLPFAVPLILGARFAPTVVPAQVLLAGTVASTVFFWCFFYYHASVRLDLWVRGYGLYAIAALAIGYLCAQRWGAPGLASTIALGKTVMTLAMVSFAFRGVRAR